MKTSCYAPKRVVRVNCSESIVRLSEVRLTLISKKCEVHITLEVKDYAIPVISKSSLIKSSSVSNLILVFSKCSNVISSKFKAVKFTLY